MIRGTRDKRPLDRRLQPIAGETLKQYSDRIGKLTAADLCQTPDGHSTEAFDQDRAEQLAEAKAQVRQKALRAGYSRWVDGHFDDKPPATINALMERQRFQQQYPMSAFVEQVGGDQKAIEAGLDSPAVTRNG